MVPGFIVVQLLTDVLVFALAEHYTSLDNNGCSISALVCCSTLIAATGLTEVLDSTGKQGLHHRYQQTKTAVLVRSVL